MPTLFEPTDSLFINTDSRILTLGIERAGVRAALLEPVSGEHRLVGWVGVARNQSMTMVEQAAEACRRLGQRLGSVLWDEEQESPFLRNIDLVRFPPLHQVMIAASPRPPLRVFLAGLSERISMAATSNALASAPVQIIGSLPHSTALDVSEVMRQLNDQQPEALLVVGGYDQAPLSAQKSMLSLCRTIGQALERLPRTLRPFIVYAGNQAVAEPATAFLRAADSAIPLAIVGNVLPKPDQFNSIPLVSTLSDYHWRLSRRIAGFREIANWVTTPGRVTMLERSFIQLVTMWAAQQGLSSLHGLYATSDLWLHVWADADGSATQLHYSLPDQRSDLLVDWPPLQLVSGDWPVDLWPQVSPIWWDRSGLAPLIGAVGQIAPLAMLQVLSRDVLIET